jgi:hypothetical protein
MVNAAQLRKVRTAFDTARARKRLVRPAVCENCNAIPEHGPLHGHHDDYLKPLDVRWLCRSCHVKHHIALRKADGTFKPGGRRAA